MKKFSKKLSLNKKTVANLNAGNLMNVRGGVINKTDYTYCRECLTGTVTEAVTCGYTCDDATCNGSCDTCVTCDTCDCTTTYVPATNPTGFPCQKDNCN